MLAHHQRHHRLCCSGAHAFEKDAAAAGDFVVFKALRMKRVGQVPSGFVFLVGFNRAFLTYSAT